MTTPRTTTAEVLDDISATLGAPVIRVVECNASSTTHTLFDAGGMTQLQFFRDHVSKSAPVLFKKGGAHFPALRKWTRDYLCEKLAGKQIPVSLTPNGRADAIIATVEEKKMFLAPAETTMPMKRFFEMLDECHAESAAAHTQQQRIIPYMQAQNGCLNTDTFQSLIPDLFDDGDTDSEPQDLAHRCSMVRFAAEALGLPPSQSNIWFGSSSSLTSLHQDWSENMYLVVRGVKTFVLIPPTDCHAVKKSVVPEGKFVFDDKAKSFSVEKVADEFMWVDFDESSVVGKKAHVHHVEVEAGDVLYLPAMWYHQVGQYEDDEEDFVSAVNFWFDADVGSQYHLHRLMKHVLRHPDV